MNRRTIILTLAACLGLGIAAAVQAVATSAHPLATRSASPPIAVPALANMGGPAGVQTARDDDVASAEAGVIAELTAPSANVPDDMLPGQVEQASVRVLLDKLGANNRAIYAYRTTKGRVCGGLTDGPSGCFEGFTAQAPVTYTFGDPDGNGTGEAPIVYGFMPNNVRAVNVVVAGTTYAATSGQNAYYFQLPNSSLSPQSIEAIIVRFVNGRSQTIPITLR